MCEVLKNAKMQPWDLPTLPQWQANVAPGRLVLGYGLYADFSPISSPHRLAHPQQDPQASTTPPNPAIDDPPHPHVATPATRRRSEPLADASVPAPQRKPEACSNLIAYQDAETGT